MGELNIFNRPCVKLEGLPLGEIGAGRLVQACLRCSPLKGGSTCHDSSNSRNAQFWSTYNLIAN